MNVVVECGLWFARLRTSKLQLGATAGLFKGGVSRTITVPGAPLFLSLDFWNVCGPRTCRISENMVFWLIDWRPADFRELR